ncbi:MAG: sugar phosphate isomerase/epimerase [Clostridiales bacterium]|nr:sugar phosphate isomerase/epimerase [Candidatus Equinaster intestinalis]
MEKIGCKVYPGFRGTAEQNLELIKAAGFDTTCFYWDENCAKNVQKASALKLHISELDMPNAESNSIWEEGTPGDFYTEKIRRCITDAAFYGIPRIVLCATATASAPKTSPIGLVRFGKLIKEAEKQGVKLCLKNAEFLRHISLLFSMFPSENLGLCYDFGHEDCLTPGIKYLPLFGQRVFCARIHDNYGFPEDKTVDKKYDLHRIPFDGALPLTEKYKALTQCGFEAPLMLDVFDRDGFYKDLSAEEFYRRAFTAAKRLLETQEK